MGNQKEIRSKIASTISTQQITKAMKLVSATKLRKAAEGIQRMRPYSEKLSNIMANLQDSVDDPQLAVYFKDVKPNKVLLVLISSDRGLCGAFNSNVVKRTKQLLQETYAEQAAKNNVHILAIGKKAGELMAKTEIPQNKQFMELLQNLSAENAFVAGEEILRMFRSGEYDRVEIVYNKFKNAATQILTNELMLPVIPEKLGGHKPVANDYIFEPSKVSILKELIPRSLKTQLYKAMLDSAASEHGARMVAMDKATENAGDLLKQYRLAYNQARQAAITNEISEIVGGAAALEG